MALYGYARVSTHEQDLAIQIEALKAAGCEVIRTEKKSGSSRQGRTELKTLLEFVREGDTLVVTRVDRLARSMGDLQDVVRDLKGRGVALKATEQPVDTSTAAGKAFLDMLGVFAEFETNLRRERQLEGDRSGESEGRLCWQGAHADDRRRRYPTCPRGGEARAHRNRQETECEPIERVSGAGVRQGQEWIASATPSRLEARLGSYARDR